MLVLMLCFCVDVCALSYNTGPCKGAFDSWFYNSAVGECLQFVYGGCEGNGNRFETKDACEQRCRQPASVESAEDRGDEFGKEAPFLSVPTTYSTFQGSHSVNYIFMFITLFSLYGWHPG